MNECSAEVPDPGPRMYVDGGVVRSLTDRSQTSAGSKLFLPSVSYIPRRRAR